MSYLIRRVLAKARLILDEMCRLYGKFTSYLRRVLCKTRLSFPRINGPIVTKTIEHFFNLADFCAFFRVPRLLSSGTSWQQKENYLLMRPSSLKVSDGERFALILYCLFWFDFELGLS